ncbi:MAG TPA: GGDEF domain-containing protein [Jatrophihabitantaceae bacterium]|nr:GGDEF domain-containing protein [Jatrophihabitantaceae bacterium]
MALVVLVDTVAALYGGWTLLSERVTSADLLRLGLLVTLSVVYLEVSRQVEHRRRLFASDDSSHMDMISVWVFAGAVMLPSGLAVGLVVIVYAHLWVRSWRAVDGIKPHRVTYTAAVVMLSVAGATALPLTEPRPNAFSTIGGAVTLVLAVVVYRAVNMLLVSSVILLSQGRSKPSTLFGSLSDNAIEFATLALGAVTAVSLVRVPWFAVMVLPAVFLLQYHALLRDLVQAATVDAKTELLNAAAWRQLAQRELSRADRQETSTAVLVIDMDRFKHINDTYGHLAGDTALRAVADALADELREYDAVGRFGGEEFVALLPGADTHSAVNVAERLRRRIETTEILVEGRNAPGMQRVHVTASVGVASTPSKSADLDDLLRAADNALYAAKHGGRNTVRVAPSAVAA